VGIAVGQMGMRLDDFLEFTPFEFQLVYSKWMERENANYRTTWEQSRFIAFITAKTQDTKNKLHKPEDLVKFGWEDDKPKRTGKLTKEEKEARIKRVEYLAEKWK